MNAIKFHYISFLVALNIFLNFVQTYAFAYTFSFLNKERQQEKIWFVKYEIQF